MAKILSLSSSEILRTTRQLVLQNEGHNVVTAADLSVIKSLNGDGKPDVALIGHDFSGMEKRKIALTLNKHWPGLPILEMCFHSPEIPGADFILTDAPDQLIAALREVVGGHRVRGFVH
jgi:DNA-binding response OmpR family regulator